MNVFGKGNVRRSRGIEPGMTSDASSTPIDFWFDPGCPFTWLTYRWIREVAPQRDLAITLRPWSLKFQNGDDTPEEYREAVEASHRALRIVVAIDAKEGTDSVARFYDERDFRAFPAFDTPDLAEVLEAAGLDAVYLDAADDESLDAVIHASMDVARGLNGGTGVPIIRIADRDTAFFGPVINELPKGDDVTKLWDLFVAITEIPELFEIKREREADLVFPERAS